MTIALIDNGSLEPAAHRHLRAVAAALADRAGEAVTAVSWKHSDRIPPEALDGRTAWTVAPWVAAEWERGEREFLFVPFFISPQGAIGSALRSDLEALAAEKEGMAFRFAPGLAELALAPGQSALAAILADRVRETMAARGLRRPPVIVVDHGGPSPSSAALRDAVAAHVRRQLGAAAGPLAAASMESPEGPAFAFNRPLLSAQLRTAGFDRGEIVIAPLFLSPGRHAGPAGDLARLARAAEAAAPGLRCHFTGLVGTHPLAVETLGRALRAIRPSPVFS